MKQIKDIATQNPEPASKKYQNCEEKAYLAFKILKLVHGQHPGVQQYHQRKVK